MVFQDSDAGVTYDIGVSVFNCDQQGKRIANNLFLQGSCGFPQFVDLRCSRY